MNFKKIIAVIIILILISFFINSYTKVEGFREDFEFAKNAARKMRDFLNTRFDLEEEEDEPVVLQQAPPDEKESDVWYTYKDKVDLSEYVLKSEIPIKNMDKYILKTKVNADRKLLAEKTKNEANKKETETKSGEVAKTNKGGRIDGRASSMNTESISNSSGKYEDTNVFEKIKTGFNDLFNKITGKDSVVVKKPPKSNKKYANKVVKGDNKKTKEGKTNNKSKSESSGIASSLKNLVKKPEPIKPDAEARRKMKSNRDIINKDNVVKKGKDTRNGNPIQFQFDKILPDNLTYTRKNKCIHSPVVGDDNTNKVDSDSEEEDNFFENLFSGEIFEDIVNYFKK